MKCLILVCVLMFSVTSFAAQNATNEYKMLVTEKGYEPNNLKVQAGKPVTLKITRKTNATCAREITVPAQKLKVDLPMDKEVTVKLAALSKGEIKFGCAMDMMIGGIMMAE